ncbi:MAG TPA: cobalt-precorrin-6A reductase [Pseudonocardiaceae bacterium]|nr:cobalt-precorrin-6A reductase [Pseudonocardiaceae bacterium]
MTVRVLLLGGTAEARRLADLLAADPTVEVITSLAGRVRTPLLPPNEVRIGGFGGPDGLTNWLYTERIDAVIDATHPFATTITANAIAATSRLSLPVLVLRRPGWHAEQGDNWHWADTLPDAAARLPALGRRVFLTTGRTDIAPFTALADLWFLLRCVDPPDPPPPTSVTVVLARGPFTIDGETALLREHRVDVLVTKDSGGDQTAAKLVAARQLGLPVVLVRRPALPDTPVVPTERDAIDWLATIH